MELLGSELSRGLTDEEASERLRTVPIGLQGLAYGAMGAVAVLLAMEIEKWLWRRAEARNGVAATSPLQAIPEKGSA